MYLNEEEDHRQTGGNLWGTAQNEKHKDFILKLLRFQDSDNRALSQALGLVSASPVDVGLVITRPALITGGARVCLPGKLKPRKFADETEWKG